MNGWRSLRRRWAQASLEYDLAHGRRQYGRAPGDTGSGSPIEPVDMVVQATIEATVIRADGTIEELGQVSSNELVLTAEQMARMDAAARRQARRGKR